MRKGGRGGTDGHGRALNHTAPVSPPDLSGVFSISPTQGAEILATVDAHG